MEDGEEVKRGMLRQLSGPSSRARVIPVAALGVLAAGLVLLVLPRGDSAPHVTIKPSHPIVLKNAGTGTNPGPKVSTNPGVKPSTNPGIKPGTNPGVKPGANPGPRPADTHAQPVVDLSPPLRDALTTRLSDRSQDLTRALGPAVRAKAVERTTSSGVRVRLGGPGYRLQKGQTELSLYSTGLGRTGDWRTFASGVARATPYGRETITIDGEKTELFQTVERSQGQRLWTWHIDTNLKPRLRDEDGAVIWQGKHPLITLPVRIYGPKGNDVTPAGAHWGLAPEGTGWSLRLVLNDATLPTPYVIDPATITYRTAQGSTSASGTTLTLTVPSGTKPTDLLIAQVVVQVVTGTITADQTGWTQIGTTITAGTGGAATTMALFRRVATGNEPASYTFAVTSGPAAGGITAFSGVDTVNPTDANGVVVSSANTGTSSPATAPTTGTLATINEQLITFVGVGGVTTVTPPASQTEKYNASVTGVTASAQVDTAALTSTSSGTRSETLGTPVRWLTATVALRPAPAFRSQSQSSNTGAASPISFAAGNPSGAAMGDLIVGSLVYSGGTNITITPGQTGWHLISRNDNGTAVGQVVYWRLRAETGNYTFSLTFSSGGGEVAGAFDSYPGVDFSTGDPVDASTTNSGASTTSLVASTVTTNTSGGMLIVFYGANNNGNSGTTDGITPPSGMTERMARASKNAGVDLESAELVLGAAGATGNKTATSVNTATQYVSTTVALRGDSAPDPYLEAILSDGPSHYWRLGETTATTQSSTSENIGIQDVTDATSMTINSNSTGTVTSGASGLIDSDNKAITFSEGTTNKSKAGFQSNATVTNPRTIEAWIKTSDKGYTSAFQKAVFSTRKSTASTNATTYFGLSGGKLFMFDNVGKSPTSITGNTTLTNGQLHYIAYVFDSTNTLGQLYVDGRLDKSVTQTFASGKVDDTTTNATIAFDLQGVASEGSLQGTIDEVATYDYALTAAQIANHFTKGIYGGLALAEVSGQGANEYVPNLDAPPSISSNSTATTGGTLAANTYYYVVTATLASGESARSNEVSQATTGATSTVTLNWTTISGATAYKVYRSTATGTETLLASPGNVTTYTDTGSATPGTTTPNVEAERSGATGPIVFYKPGATGTNAYTATASPLDSQSSLGDVTFATQANATGGGAVTPSGSPATATTTYTWNSSYAITTAQTATLTSGGYQSQPFFTPIQDACIPGRNGTGPTMGSTSTATTGGLLPNSTTFFYYVTATNSTSECETAPGSEVSQATGATASPGANQNTVTINWTAVGGATGYKVYRSTTSGAETLLAIVGSGSTSYIDTGSYDTPQGFGSAQPPANPSLAETTPTSYYTTSSIPFTTSDGIDGGGFAGGGGSGLDQTTRLTERAPATSLVNGLCTFPGSPTFGSFTSNTIPSPTDTTALADNCYRYRFSITDNVSNQSAYFSTDVKVDKTAPTNTISVTGATGAYVSGTTLYYKSDATGSFTLKNAVGDPASGVGSATFPANAATGWTHTSGSETISAPTISSSSTSTSGGTLAAGTYYYVMTALGAWGETQKSQEVSLTTTGTTSSNTLNWSAVSGATGYKIYRATSAGAEQLLATLGAVTTYNDTGASTTATSPPTFFQPSSVYSWTAGPNAPSAAERTVRGTDAAGNFTDTVLTFTTDTTAPAGGSIAPQGLVGAGSDYRTSTSVTLNLDSGSDGGSGLDTTGATSEVVERASMTMSTANTCTLDNSSTFSTAIGSAHPGASIADATIASGSCYRYRYTVKDNVGNTTQYFSGNVKVDTSAPSYATSAITGAESSALESWDDTNKILYYNPTGIGTQTFTITSTPTDAQSDIQKVNFPTVAGITGGGDDSVAPFAQTYTWTSSGATGAQTTTATNNASLTATQNFTLTSDSTAPSGGSIAPQALVGAGSDYRTSTSVTLNLATGTDAGSGIDTTNQLVERASQVMGSANTCSLDNTATFSTSVATGSLGASVADSTIASGSCYRYRYTVKDNVGNSVQYFSGNVKVDTTAPAYAASQLTGSESSTVEFWDDATKTLFYNPTGIGTQTFTITSTPTDAESDIQKVNFPAITGVTGGGDDATPPFSQVYTWTSSGATGAQTTTATNNASLTTTRAFTLTSDSTAPSGGSIAPQALVGAGSDYRTSTSVTLNLATGTDAGSGIDTTNQLVDRASQAMSTANTCSLDNTATFSTSVATGSLGASVADSTIASGSCYRYRYTVKDNVGNSVQYFSGNVKVDTTAPTFAASDLTITNVTSSPAGQSFFNSGTKTLFYNPTTGNTGSFDATATPTDTESGIQKVDFPVVFGADGVADSSSPYTTPYSWTASSSATGSKTVTATNNAASTTTQSFTVTPDSTAPTGGSITYFDGVTGNPNATVTFSQGTDATSGIGTVLLQRADATFSSGTTCGTFGAFTTIATNPSSPYADNSLALGCHKYQLIVTDNVGNSTTYTSARVYKASSPGPLTVASAADKFFTGTTLFVNNNGTGTFTITVLPAFTASVTSVDYPAGPGSGLTGSSSTTTNSGANFPSSTYTWTTAFVANATLTSTVHWTNGDTTSEPITVKPDGAAPTGDAPTYATGNQGGIAPSVTFNGVDSVTGSGIDVTKTKLLRRSVAWSGGTCTFTGQAFAQIGATGASSPFVDSLPSEACYQYQTQYTDNVGNVSASFSGSGTYQYDSGAPTSTIGITALTGTSVQFFKSSTNTLYYNPSTGLTFQVTDAATDAGAGVASVDFPVIAITGFNGTALTDTSSPYASNTYTVTSSNTTAPSDATVTVTDNVGGAGHITNDTLHFALDNTNPTGSITAPAASAKVRAGVTVSSSSADGGSGIATVQFQVATSGGGFSNLGSALTGSGPYSVTWTTTGGGYPDGNYDLRVITTDNVGNAFTSAIVTVTVDNTAPAAPTITTAPPTFDNVPTAITWTGESGGTFQCSVDGGAFATCTSPFSTSSLSEGAHTFAVKQIDDAGNVGPATSTISWTKDTTPPAAPTITGQPASPSSSSTFTFTGESSATFKCSVDSGAFTTCTSPFTPSPALADGSHTFAVKQTDQAGNTGPATSTITWTLDTVALPPTITTSPSDPSTNTTPTFAWTGESGATFQCKIDGGSFSACTSPLAVSPALADGSHTFQVKQTDTAGNTSTAASYTWTVDTTAPAAPTITSGPTSGTTSTSATFAFTGEAGATFLCAIDGGSFTSCSSPKTFTGLATGSHTFQVKQTDAAGHTGPAASYPWTISSGAVPTLLSAVVGTAGTPITLTYDTTLDSGSAPAPSAYTLLVDGVAVTPTVTVAGTTVLLSVSPAILSGQVVTLSYTVPATSKVRSTLALDAGPFTSLSVTNNTTVGAPTQAPTLDDRPAQPSTTNAGTFTFHSDEYGVTGFECSLDDGAYTACTSPFAFSGLPMGSHTFCVRAANVGGHGPATCFTWEIAAAMNDAPPFLVSTSPVDGSNITEVGPTWKLVVSEPVTWSDFAYSGPAGAPTAFFNPGGDMAEAPFTSTVPGRYTISATVSDGVNPPVHIEAHFTIPEAGDDHPPTSMTVYHGEAGTLQTSDGSASMHWPSGMFSDSVVVTIDPLPIGTVSTGFSITGYAVDIQAWLLVSRQAVDSFNDVLDVEFPNTPADALAAVSQNDPNNWTPLPALTSHDLPADVLAGYYRDPAGTVHVLTRHLTYYAILSDTEGPKWNLPPGAPILHGTVTKGSLELNWEPATDNSGSIGQYRLYVNGVSIRSFSGKTLSAALGPYSDKDTRIFQVVASDPAGHTSQLSNALRALPVLVGLSLDDAQKALAARGFKLGKITGRDIADQGGAVSGQVPPTPALASIGSAIDVQFGVSRAPWKLTAAGAEKLNVKQRRVVALRVFSTLKANVAITLRQTKLAKKHYRWRFKVTAGSTIVKLPVPRELRKAGKFTIYIAGYHRGYKRILRKVKIRFLSPGGLSPILQPPLKPIDIVLINGPDVHKDLALGLTSSFTVRKVSSTDAGAAFDLTSGSSSRIGAIVVDLDSTDLSFVRDLHLVFPDLRIIAVASSPKLVGQAKLAGAAVVLSRPLQPRVLSSVVRQLLDQRAVAQHH